MTSSPNKSNKFKHFFIWGSVLVLVIILLVTIRLYTAPKIDATKKDASVDKNKITEVKAEPVLIDDVTLYQTSAGTVTALQQVVIKPQSSGQIKQIYFKDGQYVQQGQLLAKLDDSAIQATLKQNQAQIAQLNAQINLVQTQLQQYKTLLTDNAVSQNEVNQLQSQLQQLMATKQAAQATLQFSQTMQTYSLIKAPFSGKLGYKTASVGSQLSANGSDGLVSISQISPIAIDFGVPITNISQPAGLVGNSVTVLDATGQNTLSKGQISVIDNQVAANTGQIKLRVVLQNGANVVIAGQPVQVKWPIQHFKQAMLVGLNTLRYDTESAYVFVVAQNNNKQTIAVKTPVKVLATINKQVVVTGVNQNQQIISTGFDKLKDKAIVTVNNSKNKNTEEIVKPTQPVNGLSANKP